MKLMRYIGAISVAGTLSLSVAGTALADDVSVDNTGPDSTNTVTIDNTTSVTTTNTNNVTVANVNLQAATTGDVKADHNTSVGGLVSGAASNDSVVSTSVSISNEAAAVDTGGAGGGNPGGAGGAGGNVPGGAGGAGGAGGFGGGGARVLGASTGGLGAGAAAVLPEVGASVPVDVSALRADWPPRSNAAKAVTEQASKMSAAMLIIASLLAMIGAIASFVYAKRQEGRA